MRTRAYMDRNSEGRVLRIGGDGIDPVSTIWVQISTNVGCLTTRLDLRQQRALASALDQHIADCEEPK